ncbi:hypothetical protein NOF04DRAFT_1361697 [Fusarium oxysporum II5]|nr:hypothetical protein DER44DRAFT_875069 [Fusarium oxysporum]KAK2125184.1 hypothetical protein NOF04DRAFT_1361697 [Fusarium oxysporum II5]
MAISAKPSRTRMVTDPAAHLCRQGLDICQSPARTSCNRQRGGYGWLRILAKPTHGYAAKQDTCTGDVTISGPLVWFFSVRMLAAPNLGPASCPRGARNGQDMRGQGRQLRDGSPRRKAFSGRPDTEFKTRFTKTTWSDTREGLIRSPRERVSCVRQSGMSQQRTTSRALDKAGIGNVRPKETQRHPKMIITPVVKKKWPAKGPNKQR